MMLDDFVRHFDRAVKRGTGFMVRCPAHEDKNPSLHVTPSHDRLLVKCFAGCTAAEIVEAMGLTMRDLFYDQDGYRSLAPRYPRPTVPVQEDRALWPDAPIQFLKRRGLDYHTAIEAGAWADDNAIYFPMTRDGQAINVKTRYLPKGFALAEDAELVWLGLDWCMGQGRIVVCEGELDVLTFRQCGIKAVLSPPNGAQKGELPFFGSAAAIFERAEVVLIATDADDVGQAFGQEVARRVGPEKCKRIEWPEGCNDANDVLLTFGPETLRTLCREAIPFPVSGIIRPMDVARDYRKLYAEGLPRGHKTPWPSLNRYYSIVDGYVTAITATPNSGKSEWVDALFVGLAAEHDWRFSMFSPESRPTELHLSRWAEKYVGLPFLPGRSRRMAEDQAEDALSFAEDHLSFIDPEEPYLDTILRLFSAEVLRRGVKAVVIDPWNELIDKRPNGMREDEFLGQLLRKVRRWAFRHKCHVFIVVHPHAMQLNKEGQYPVVNIYDLNGGAAWINKIDALLSIWRDKVDWTQPVQVHCLKAKNKVVGRLGRADLRYEHMNGRYEDTGVAVDAG